MIPNTSLSIFENAIYPWRGESISWFRDELVNKAYKFDFPIHKPFFELSEAQKDLIWTGNSYFQGLNDFFKELEDKNYKIQNRVMLSRYRGKTKCNACKGKRLRIEASYVKINSKTVSDLVDLPIKHLVTFFKNIDLDVYEQQIAKTIIVGNQQSFILFDRSWFGLFDIKQKFIHTFGR